MDEREKYIWFSYTDEAQILDLRRNPLEYVNLDYFILKVIECK